MNRYREQYERMERRFARFSNQCAPLLAELSEESLMDDVQAFFECCLHLEDWIKNDEELPLAVRRAARPYVQASSVLRLCRDIAITAKHLTVETPLTKDHRISGREPTGRAAASASSRWPASARSTTALEASVRSSSPSSAVSWLWRCALEPAAPSTRLSAILGRRVILASSRMILRTVALQC